MEWSDFVEAATATSWIAYLGTADARGRPHVSAVAPGFGAGRLWVATRASSRKYANLRANPQVAFHWPVGNSQGPGEVYARGTVELWEGPGPRRRLWDEAPMPYDLAGFFGSADNDDLVFIEALVQSATILGPDFVRRVWKP